MVLDRLENLEQYASLNPRFPAAFAYLRRLLAEDAPNGRHVLPGTDAPEDIFVNLCTCDLALRDTARAESHMAYIDVQVVLSGDETMYVPSEAPAVTEADAEKDFRLYAPVPLSDCSRLTVRAGSFAIFFPGELHAPCHALAAPSHSRKAILKVRQEAPRG